MFEEDVQEIAEQLQQEQENTVSELDEKLEEVQPRQPRDRLDLACHLDGRHASMPAGMHRRIVHLPAFLLSLER